MPKTDIFSIRGGSVQANKGLYIRRSADNELLGLCQAGAFAYVLTPRQMGKSSLMENTAAELEREKILSLIVDLQLVGVKVTRDQWYYGILSVIHEKAKLKTDLKAWWEEHKRLGAAQRMNLFLKDVLLANIPPEQKVIIFIDEIDSTLSLDFTDDLFTAIRAIYSARPTEPAFRRLSFVLVGVATPTSLIKDSTRTPFNIGQRVDLTDFTLEEALPLTEGFDFSEVEAKELLQKVLAWTSGHPYLTQQLCYAIATRREHVTWTDEEVAKIVAHRFFGKHSDTDSNLSLVREMLTNPDRFSDIESVLKTYQKVLRGKVRVPDDEQSPVKSYLKLSGVVIRDAGELHIRNRIYSQVFNEVWAKQHTPKNWLRMLTRVAASLAILAVLISAALAPWALYERRRANNALTEVRMLFLAEQEATRRANEARIATENALRGEQRATAELGEALERLRNAKEEAESQRELAQNAAKNEAIQRKKAEDAQQQAEIARQDAEKIGQTCLITKLVLASQSLKENTNRLPDRLIIAQEAYNQAKQAESAPRNSDPATEVQRVPLSVAAYAALLHPAALLPRPLATPFSFDSYSEIKIGFQDDGRKLEGWNLDNGKMSVAEFDSTSGSVKRLDLGPAEPLRNPNTRNPGHLTRSADRTVFHDSSGREVELEPISGRIVASDINLRRDRIVFAIDSRGEKVLGVWNLRDGKKLFEQPVTGLRNVSFSSWSDHVFTIADGGLQIWDTDIRVEPIDRVQPLKNIPVPLTEKTPDNNIQTLALNNGLFSEDRSHAVLWNSDAAEVWDLTAILDPKLMRRIVKPRETGPNYNAHFIVSAISADGKMVLTQSLPSGAVTLWKSSVLNDILLDKEREVIKSAFSADGKSLVTVARETARVWNTVSGRESYRAVEKNPFGEAVAISPDGGRLATVTINGSVRVWDLSADLDPLHRSLWSEEKIVGLNIGKQYFLTRKDASELMLWDLNTNQIGNKIPLGEAEKGDISADGKVIAVLTDNNKTIKVWRDGRPTSWQLKTPSNDLALSDDGRFVAATESNRTVLVWELNEGKVGDPSTLPLTQDVSKVQFAPNSHTLLTFDSSDGHGQLWDVSKKKPLSSFINGAFVEIIGYVFSQDGAYLAVITGDGDGLILVNTVTGETIDTLYPDEKIAWVDLVVSGNLYILATASRRNGFVNIWRWARGEKPKEAPYINTDDDYTFVSLSRDGLYLAGSADDQVIWIWDISDPRQPIEVARVNSTEDVDYAFFSSNGKYLYILTGPNELQLWNWKEANVIRQLQERLIVGKLTCDQWREYLEPEEMGPFSECALKPIRPPAPRRATRR